MNENLKELFDIWLNNNEKIIEELIFEHLEKDDIMISLIIAYPKYFNQIDCYKALYLIDKRIIEHCILFHLMGFENYD